MAYGALALFYGGLESLLGPPQMVDGSLIKSMEQARVAPRPLFPRAAAAPPARPRRRAALTTRVRPRTPLRACGRAGHWPRAECSARRAVDTRGRAHARRRAAAHILRQEHSIRADSTLKFKSSNGMESLSKDEWEVMTGTPHTHPEAHFTHSP
eukprot:1046972-Prymnesium_polylepis.2